MALTFLGSQSEGPTLQSSVMMVVVPAMVTCSQINFWKAGTPTEYTLDWAQQGQREPTRTPSWGPCGLGPLDRTFFHP